MKPGADSTAELGDFLARCGGTIRDHGCVILWIFDPAHQAPPFAYSVGLTERFNHPELILFGLGHDVALAIINTLVRRYVRRGWPAPVDQPIERVIESHPVVVKAVCAERAYPYVRFAAQRCAALERPLRVQQIILPDANGRFPWEGDYDPRMESIQPRLFELH